MFSLFNDVMGPVMRGPSSSHTAGSHRIGLMARALLGSEPARAVIVFDRHGSYGKVYREQGVDLGFAAGLLGWAMTDERFPRALALAAQQGVRIDFRTDDLQRAEHPNHVRIGLHDRRGGTLSLEARSIGGGMVEITRVDGFEVLLDGKAEEVLVTVSEERAETVVASIQAMSPTIRPVDVRRKAGAAMVCVALSEPPAPEAVNQLRCLPGVRLVRKNPPVFFVLKGQPLFTDSESMVVLAKERECSLGEIALAYEAQLLGVTEEAAMTEMIHRYHIMKQSVAQGLDERTVDMMLLGPSASRIADAEKAERLAAGGPHTRAAFRALAVMHTSNSKGVVCAGPTGGSAGTIPGVVLTLAEERGLKEREIGLSLFAASAAGLMVAQRATFAAEVAGCQVEIGAAGAMAAAAVVEAVGGTPRQATDAAAVALQNTMGSVCDLVQGICEIPCHTRNAAAAAGAFVCADLILGGYENPIPLDETIDAVYSVGKMLPHELRCTALGGLAATPSAINMVSLKRKNRL